jgi:hypothetical protein
MMGGVVVVVIIVAAAVAAEGVNEESTCECQHDLPDSARPVSETT